MTAGWSNTYLDKRFIFHMFHMFNIICLMKLTQKQFVCFQLYPSNIDVSLGWLGICIIVTLDRLRQ